MSETEATFSYKKYIYILTFENLNVFFAKGLVIFIFAQNIKCSCLPVRLEMSI